MSDFVTVTKDGEFININSHPACVADHKRLGWREATKQELAMLEQMKAPVEAPPVVEKARGKKE